MSSNLILNIYIFCFVFDEEKRNVDGLKKLPMYSVLFEVLFVIKKLLL